jgi:dTDP-4-dehydrorhamnose reductase
MRILLTGASGQLGPYIVRRLLRDGHDLALWSQSWSQPVLGIPVRQVELADFDDASRAFAEAAPRAVIHAAAISNMQQALSDPARAERVNTYATAGLAELAGHYGARMIYLSTDLVFDGEQQSSTGYKETDPPRPLSCYAQTKLMGEGPVRLKERNLVVRLPLVIGPSLNSRLKFFDHLLAALRDKRKITLFDDEWRTPIAPDVVADGLALAIAGDLAGLFHLAGPDRLSRYDIGVQLARIMNLDPSPIIAASRLSLESPEPRPRDTSLDASKWYAALPHCPHPTFEESLTRLPSGPK